jgi:hypothetical protein
MKITLLAALAAALLCAGGCGVKEGDVHAGQETQRRAKELSDQARERVQSLPGAEKK